MEEDFKNANILIYKYRYLIVLVVVLLAYYYTDKKHKVRNAIIAGLIALVVILLYSKYIAKRQVALLASYEQHLSGADMEQPMMAQEFGEQQIEQFKRSALAQAADNEINTKPIGSYIAKAVTEMEDSQFKNKDINVIRGQPGIAQGTYFYGPITENRAAMAMSAVDDNARKLTFAMF